MSSFSLPDERLTDSCFLCITKSLSRALATGEAAIPVSGGVAVMILLAVFALTVLACALGGRRS